MNNLISRQVAIDQIECLMNDKTKVHYNHGCADAIATLTNLPPAQSQQQAPIGEWVPSTKYKGFLTCSACEDCYIENWSDKEKKWKFCPQCGTRMS